MASLPVRYHVLHETFYDYGSAVSLSQQQLHLSPRVLAWQQVEAQRVDLDPPPTWRRDGLDAFGNPVTWIAFHAPHDKLRVVSAMNIAIDPHRPEHLEASLPWEEVRDRLAYSASPPRAEDLDAARFLFESAHVRVKKELADYAADCFPPGRPVLVGAQALMDKIFTEFEFDPEATTVSTPVMEVLEKKRGVCQDFAHLMIACLRAQGLAARYVSGYLLTRPPPGKPRLIGADASHAWVSVYAPGFADDWVDFDPTNNLLPDTEHITLAFGRDFGDVSPMRGIILGGGGHEPEVAVTVTPLDEEYPLLSPQSLGEVATAAGTHPRLMPRVAIVGGGPAGLMAAEQLVDVAGLEIDVFEAMPSVGRKFLMAGKGGMNITHAEPLADFIGRYGECAGRFALLLEDWGPQALREWIGGLGIDTFVGTSGRVFPAEMKAAPLLRAWLHRLREGGVRFHVRQRWLGWHDDGRLRIATPSGEVAVAADALVLALGGGSWARLGSDGAWVPLLAGRGIAVAPLRPANCGFDVAWSAHFSGRFAGEPVKPVAASFAGERRAGEFNITANGIEGGLVYALSAPLRDALERTGEAQLVLDLAPGRSLQRLTDDLSRPRGRDSLANHLRRHAAISGVKAGLLREFAPPGALTAAASLAAAIKALPVPLKAARPLDEAISSAGGVEFAELDEYLMLKRLPGVFCAGEMLDWEAPTGGYLLTACLATGRAAGRGARDWMARGA